MITRQDILEHAMFISEKEGAEMITREDILEQAAARIYLGLEPARAIASVYREAFKESLQERPKGHIDEFVSRRNLTLAFAYTLDVSPELNYTLFYPTAAAKLTMSPYVHGSIIDDFFHRGESPTTVSKYLLAFAKAGELGRFPAQLLDLVDVDRLTPLPSRATDRGPLVSPPTEPGASELHDPDLDADLEELLYDDQAD